MSICSLNRWLIFRLSYELSLRKFQHKVNPLTWNQHDKLLAQAFFDLEANSLGQHNSSKISILGGKLRSDCLSYWQNKYADSSSLRVLVHIPPQSKSPGGYSLFSNIVDCLNYMGITARGLSFTESLSDCLYEFCPSLFITSDNSIYTNNIDWPLIADYRINNSLKVGLTAYIEEYGFSSPLNIRLDWARKNNIDFYYSFRSPQYLSMRKEYKPFFDSGFSIFSIEFGFNPLYYYPVDSIYETIPYTFLASSNIDKQKRYQEWLLPVVSRYPGIIDGPGWTRLRQIAPRSIHRFLYARASVGLNLHIDASIDYPSELNERTYILAACGVPQLIDNPMLLDQRFSSNSYFSASNPNEYTDLFSFMISNPLESQERALSALKEAYEKHTYFQRLDNFITNIQSL